MRVYEFAKEHGLSSKELVVLLAKEGFEVSSHMSVLSDKAISFLENKYKKAEIKPEVKKEVVSEVKPSVAPIEVTKESVKLSTQPQSVIAKEEKKVIHAPSSTTQPVEQKKSAPISAPTAQEKSITLKQYILSDLAAALAKTSSDLILTLLKWGILSNKNLLLNEETVERLAKHYEVSLVKPVEKPKEETRTFSGHLNKDLLKTRLPVIVVMGHVDHGKTTLLDFIRKTRVAAKEKGGITQHLGAYEAKTPQGDLVFIDTPGHEAFSKIRMRGTKVADIVVLVVAADDGIMPQTIEALKHAQSMNVAIVVAINKVDKVEKARVDVVKRDLATQHALLPEEWGGQTIYVPISAKTGLGVDKLLEMLVLQSQLMELQAQATGSARGFVLESKLEKGRGPVATILTQHGILKIGDHFVAGKTTGKVSSMVDSYGNRINESKPSHPVLVAGFNEMPEAGDYFEVIDKDAYLKTKSLFAGQRTTVSTHRLMQTEKAIVLIVKTDTNSSKEALLESIAKISKKSEKGFMVLQSGLGNISESDVMLAADTGAKIITLHAKAESNAAALAGKLGVSIVTFDIIYKLLEYLQEFSESMATVKMVRAKTGEAFVRKVFDIKNLGVIAGSYVKTGVFSRDGMVVIWRGSKKIGEGKITSLQRDKNTVKEVHAGYECAFMVENFTDWQIDDRVECYVERPETKK
jgi:translation initiation factor IF-2